MNLPGYSQPENNSLIFKCINKKKNNFARWKKNLSVIKNNKCRTNLSALMNLKRCSDEEEKYYEELMQFNFKTSNIWGFKNVTSCHK